MPLPPPRRILPALRRGLRATGWRAPRLGGDPVTVTDARGRVVPLLALRTLIRRAGPGTGARRLRWAYLDAISARTWAMLAAQLAIYTVLAVQTVGILRSMARIPSAGPEDLAVPALLAAGCVLWTIGVLAAAIRSESVRIAAGLVAAGSCAACGYPIGELRPGSDGLTLCPECGAAWQREV